MRGLVCLGLVVAALACRSSALVTPGGSQNAPIEAPRAVTPARVAAATASDPVVSPPCAIGATLVLGGEGKDETDSLENVRVLAEGGRTLVTWERLNEPGMGDYSRTANVAWVGWPASAPVVQAALPSRAYASAVYSYIGPTHIAGQLGLLAYGLAGAPVFGGYTQGPATWTKIDPYSGAPPAAAASLRAPIALGEAPAVAASVPVAVVGGHEGPCESYYSCEAAYAAANARGLDDSLRLVVLSSPARSDILWRGRGTKTPRSFVPAIAAGASAGAVVYRVDGALFLVRFDAAFVHAGSPPEKIADGDVGAPAVAVAGDAIFVVWAERRVATEPYHLVLWSAPGAAPTGTRTDVRTGAESAFAPGLAAHDGELLVTWMEGDARHRGVVRLGRVAAKALAPPSVQASFDLSSAPSISTVDGNARDPEVSASGDDVVLVWSEFSGAAPGGRVQVRRLACPRLGIQVLAPERIKLYNFD